MRASVPPPPRSPCTDPGPDPRGQRPAADARTDSGDATDGPASTDPSGGDARERAEDLTALADWMTEEVAQQLYAARQDLADIAHEDDTKRAEVDDVNAQLLHVIRSLHEIAGVLREGAADARRARTTEALADEVRATSATAHDLIVECLALVDRGLRLHGRVPPGDAAPPAPAED
jgi:hypothetical protein